MPKRTKARPRSVVLRRPSDKLDALHEAAHAVALVRYGFGCTCASIRNSRDNFGHAGVLVEWSRAKSRRTAHAVRSAKRYAVMCLAAYAAERRLRVPEGLAWAHAALDLKDAKKALAFAGWSTEAGKRAAKRFVERPANWRAINTVARELVKRRELDGVEVAILIDIADGRCARRELARYRAARTCDVHRCVHVHKSVRHKREKKPSR
jgi:hypothetical protein